MVPEYPPELQVEPISTEMRGRQVDKLPALSPGERQAKAPVSRLTPVAHECAHGVHRALVERRDAVQVESQSAHLERDVAADASEHEGVGAGEPTGEVEGGRAITHFERVQQASHHGTEPC